MERIYTVRLWVEARVSAEDDASAEELALTSIRRELASQPSAVARRLQAAVFGVTDPPDTRR